MRVFRGVGLSLRWILAWMHGRWLPSTIPAHFVALAFCALACGAANGGCWGRTREEEVRRDAITGALFGLVDISVDGRQVVCFGENTAVVWRAGGGRPTCHDTDMKEAWHTDNVEGSPMLYMAYNSSRFVKPRKGVITTRHIATFDPGTGAVRQRWLLPDGPFAACWLTPECVVAACSEKGAVDSHSRIAAWQIRGNTLVECAAPRRPGADVRVGSMSRVSNSEVLCHWNVIAAGGASARSEVALVEPFTGQIRYCDTSVSVTGWGQLRVGSTGRYALVYNLDAMEVRELPSLRLVKKRRVENEDPPLSAALSADGRYVAFGGNCISVWDTHTDQIRVIDELNRRIAQSKKLVIGEGYGPPHPLTIWWARNQYAVGAIRFVAESHRAVGVTRDGLFGVWDVAAGKVLEKKRIAEVDYLGTVEDAVH